MKNFLKVEKGITLVALTITVTILLILTSVVLYNVKDNLGSERVKAMQVDVTNLKEKVLNYNADYGKVPTIGEKFTNIGDLQSAGILSDATDTGEFYVINLKELENLTLNYGRDYEKVTESSTTTDVNNLKDIYIINTDSLNVFYVAGVEYKGKIYYTDYTEDEVDQNPINLKTVESARKTGIVMEKNTVLRDDFGNLVTVPEGFKIPKDSDTNVVGGVVIQDQKYQDTKGSEFVWIPTGDIYINEYEETINIELNRYTFNKETGEATKQGKATIEGIYEELEKSDRGNETAKNLKTFLESADSRKNGGNGGYYLGRYEARTNTNRGYDNLPKTPLTTRPDEYVYNNVTEVEASKLSREMYFKDKQNSPENPFESDLVNSYAWDTAIAYIQMVSEDDNYSNKSDVSKGLAPKGTNSESKERQDEICKIWDLASNLAEMTTETPNNSVCTARGGSYGLSDEHTSSKRITMGLTWHHGYSFRPILYLKPTGNKPQTEYPQIDVGDNATENSTINGEKPSYKNPVIPKGFKAINEGNANWEDENGYNNGLVIEDVSAGDSTTVGNQFVWIPVENYDNFHLIEGYADQELDILLAYAKDPVREAGSSKTENLPGKPNLANTVLGNSESVAMYASVKKSGGFYIARFEAGIEGTKDNGSLSIKKPTDGTVKPLSKKGLGVWNDIPWSISNGKSPNDGLSGDDTQDGAVKVSRNLYKDKNRTTVTSTLCYGVQWDAIMNFLDPKYVEGKCDVENSIVANSTGKGNYSGKISTTGYYQEKNIYDLAGNIQEWTMEACDSEYRVSRGNYYDDDALNYPASSRFTDFPGYSDYYNTGFRPALYV